MRRFILFPLLCIMAAGAMLVACGDDSSGPEPQMLSFAAIAGEWSGTVYQTNPDTSYTTILTLDTEAEYNTDVGTVEYPGLECGGDLRAVQASAPNYRVSEHMTYGAFGTGGCSLTGVISLTHDPEQGTLAWEWCCREFSEFWGVLTRQ